MPLTLPTKKVLTLQAARLMADAAEATAARNGWTVVIAVVDDGGHAVLLQRIDGTQASSIDTALGKARTAVGYKRPTRVLAEMVDNGRVSFLSAGWAPVALQGGLPIEIDGQLAGGIGVSGVRASDDEIVAQAGLDALMAALKST
jgi:glc operon protein GlcG